MTLMEPGGGLAESGVLDALDAAALMADADGRIRATNDIAEQLYARPDAPLVGELLLSRLFSLREQPALEPVVAQVLEGRPWSGRLDVRHADGSAHATEVLCSPLRSGERVVGFALVLEDLPTEQGYDETRRVRGRLTRLTRVTSELVSAETVQQVTKIVVAHSADAVGATVASLSLVDRKDNQTIRLVGLNGGVEGEAAAWATFPITSLNPAAEVVRTGKRLLLTGEAEIKARYPDIADRGERSVISLPLHVGPRTIGAIGLSFPGIRTLDDAELEFFDILADTCAQAIERIAVQEVASLRRAKLGFLADAAAELSSSLDYQATLAKVAELAVPHFADWCAIDLVDDGVLRRLAVAHVDPAKVALAKELQEKYPPDPDAPNGAWQVMKTGQSELLPEITDEMLVAGATDEEQLRIARELHLRSAVTVPLIARDRVLGVLTWVSAESDRLFTPDDLTFAEDLAKRAAIAIDNAELHSQTLAAAVQLQNAVLPESMPVIDGWQIAAYYRPSGRTEVGGDFYDAIPLSGNRVALFVGDVMGRGVNAAAAMAQMRAAVRAYAALDPTPEVVMANLDRMFAQYPTEQMVTLVYVVVDPDHNELLVTNAGHPPPAVLRADGSVEHLPFAEGAPLGTVEQTRTQSRIPFCPGDTIVGFTDGLIERREEDISAGQQRLLDALPVLAGEYLVESLETLGTHLLDPHRDDDVAALAARRTG